jgi:capsid protein
MVRKHLDYVSQFEFHARTDDDTFNTELETFIDWWSQRENFDAAGRHRRSRFMRLLEARRVLDGDILPVKIHTGHVQAIEGDRVRNRTGLTTEPGTAGRDWVHGIECDSAGKAIRYAVHRRTRLGGFEFERYVPAEHAYLHGYFDRFDQVRGISPILAGVNSLRDVYENFDYALAKAKVEQLFALAFYRNAEESLGQVEAEPTDDSETSDEETTDKPRYNVSFGRGPVMLDLEPGDRAEFLESKHPSSQFREFTLAVLAVAIKSLDLPY